MKTVTVTQWKLEALILAAMGASLKLYQEFRNLEMKRHEKDRLPKWCEWHEGLEVRLQAEQVAEEIGYDVSPYKWEV